MENNDFINGLLNDIAEEMEEFNELNNENEISIPFYMTVISQAFLSGEYEEFLRELKENVYSIELSNVGGYYNTVVFSILSKKDEDDESYNQWWYNMELDSFDNWCGYCECNINDKDYNIEHQCCGINCDWNVPEFRLIKCESVGEYRFKGKQRDLWDAEDRFTTKRTELKKEEELKVKKSELIYEIESRKKEINALQELLNQLER